MKRVGFSFFIEIEYERLPIYCNFCKCTRHNLDECKRRTYIEEKHEKKQKIQYGYIKIPPPKRNKNIKQGKQIRTQKLSTQR